MEGGPNYILTRYNSASVKTFDGVSSRNKLFFIPLSNFGTVRVPTQSLTFTVVRAVRYKHFLVTSFLEQTSVMCYPTDSNLHPRDNV